MNASEKLNATDGITVSMSAGAGINEKSHITGHYEFECFDAEGRLLWSDGFDNVVTYVGQNQLLAQITGNTTAVGPYMGLIGNNTTGPVVGDTLSSHSGWTEASASQSPTYGGTRPTVSLNAPSNGNITTSAAASFTFTGPGNVTGGIVVFGPSATNVAGATTGVLLSAGNLTTVQPVIATNVLNVNWSLAL